MAQTRNKNRNTKKNPKSLARAITSRPKPRAQGGKRPVTKREGLGGLNAAATVLIDTGKPMRCPELVEQMLKRGLWTTGGKTPASTIGAALTRDIQAKKSLSRFRKAGRGLFAANCKGVKP